MNGAAELRADSAGAPAEVPRGTRSARRRSQPAVNQLMDCITTNETTMTTRAAVRAAAPRAVLGVERLRSVSSIHTTLVGTATAVPTTAPIAAANNAEAPNPTADRLTAASKVTVSTPRTAPPDAPASTAEPRTRTPCRKAGCSGSELLDEGHACAGLLLTRRAVTGGDPRRLRELGDAGSEDAEAALDRLLGQP